MPNEIYHRSNFGNPNAEGFGDAYYDNAATNKLFVHSDNYENSDGTDATLKDLNNKASIVLTPTAYSDGSLNTVIPPYQVLPTELVTNGDFSNGTTDWIVDDASNGDISVVDGKLQITSNGGTGYPVVKQSVTTSTGKKYSVSFSVTSNTTGFWFRVNDSQSGLGGFKTFYSNDKTSSIIFKGEFTAISTNSWLKIFAEQNDSGSFKIDNVSVKEVQEADFDFSRGSSATRVNEQGLVEDVQILSGELVQNGDFEQIGSELVTNGDFDTDSDWSNSGSWSIGNGVATYDGLLNIKRIYQTVNFVQNKIYKISFDITNTVDDYIDLFFGQDATTLIGRTDYAVGSYEFYVTATSTSQNLSIYAYNTSYGGGSIDNVSVKEVGQNWTFGTGWSIEDGVVSANAPSGNLDQSLSATSGSKYRVTFTISNYVSGDIRWRFTGTSNENGTLRSANGTYTEEITLTNNQSIFRFPATSGVMDIDNVSIVEVTDDTDLPRIDFTDGTGSLLLEPQRTNFITYSEDFSQWASSGVTITSNSAISPDGTQNASLFSHSGGSFPQIALSGITFVSSANYFPSLYVKSDGTTQVQHSLIVNGQVVNFTPTNEWVRVSDLIVSPDTSGSFVIAQNSGSAVAASFYIWGGQLEQGDYATSYIPTSGSTVTRSADVANNSGNADLFNDSEGVLYAEIKKDSNALDNAFSMITIGDALNNRVQINLIDNSNDFRAFVGSSSGTNFISSAFNYGSYNKIALSYNSSGFKVFHDGTLVGSDSNTISGLNLQELKFRFATNTQYDFYGDVKCVAVFKEALSNDLLERLTGEGYESFRLLAEANNYTII